jgi:hypothetical protein
MNVKRDGVVKLIFKSGYVHEFDCEMNVEDNMSDDEIQDNMIKLAKVFIGDLNGQELDKTWGAMDIKSAYAVNCKEVVFATIILKE